MPLELIATDASTFSLREYELPGMGSQDVRVRVEYASPKHGTEAHALQNRGSHSKIWDPDLRLFVPRPADTANSLEELATVLGDMVVGVVTKVGSDVTRFQRGDLVCGYGKICEEHQTTQNRLRPLGTLTRQEAVCIDPAFVALIAIRDGNVRLGDQVAVFGLGAIGQFAIQLCRVAGVRCLLGVSGSPNRRDCGLYSGAHEVFAPDECDAAWEIKRATGGGVDVAIVASDQGDALNHAIRSVRQCGTIVMAAWGPADPTPVRFDEEFHRNRPVIIGSQATWGNPDRSYPLWDRERGRQEAYNLFADKRIKADRIITPEVSLKEAAQQLPKLFANPSATIKSAILLNE